MAGVATALRLLFPRTRRPVRLIAPPPEEPREATPEATPPADVDEQTRCTQLLQNLGGAVLWESDPAGVRMSFVSASASKLLGIEARAWQAEPGFLRKHVLPEDWGRLIDTLYRAAEVGGTQTCRHRMIKADGTTLRVHTSVRPGKTVDGAFALFGVTMDTSREPHDEGQSETFFRLLVEGVQDYAVFMLSPEGIIENWNRGAQRVKGYRAHEIVGVSASIFFPAEDTLPRLLDQAALRGSATHEGWLVRKGGARFWGVVTLGAVEDDEGHLVGFSNVARDLSERYRIERSQAFLSEASAVLASSLDYPVALERITQLATRDLACWCVIHMVEAEALRPVAVAHAERDKEKLAQAALHVLPRAPQQPHVISLVAQTGRSELSTDTSPAPSVAESLGVEPAEALQQLGFGSYMCIPLTVRGATFGVITFVSDAARRYGRQDVLIAEEFARRAALAVDNTRLYREAQEAVRARDELISMASHDLRGPLTTIRLQVQSLARGLQDERKELGTKLELVGGQVDRMVHMMDLLLDISLITAGQVELQREPVDLVALVRRCAAQLAENAEAGGCELRIEARGEIVGSWDRMRIEQVVTNLLTNAIKFGPGEPVEVTIEAAGPSATLIVCDHGVGIAPEHQVQIFDRFERLHAKKGANGFGIGLWIVRRIVEAHGGQIHVDSRPGIGATFTVELPRS